MWPSTAAWLDPDSNQTSMMSISFLNDVSPHLAHFVSAGRSISASGVYQASAPFSANSFATLRLTSGLLTESPQPSHKNTAIGVPQILCLEMHQSGRVAIMLAMRSSPQAGSHFTFLISSSVLVRRVAPPFLVASIFLPAIGVSMRMNHCSVARKMIGLWQRQQCG